MTAFDTAWSLLKEWTPDWRQKIDALPLIDEANDFDFNFNWEDRDAVKNARMQSNYYLPKDIVPFVHPHSDSFVAKRPGSSDFFDEEALYRNIMRMRANPFNVALEELGYPVVSEMHREGDGFFNIQPRLITGPGEHWEKVGEKPPYERPGLTALAQRVLDGIATDKHGDNIGIDPKGLPRFFDFNLQGGPWSVGFDNYKEMTPKERAEDWMGRTHAMGLELPVSRLIDRLPDMTDIRGLEDDGYWMENDMDELRANQEGIREFLELIEPHSRHSTKEVTHDGKAIWGSDWNSLDPR